MQEIEILPVKSAKDKIHQPLLCEEGWLPKLNTTSIICGQTASGKTVLLHNILTRFLKRCFDKIYIISPTADLDSIQQKLGIPACRVITDLEGDAPKALDLIMAHQKKEIQKNGPDGSDMICILFDDIVGHSRFLSSKQLTNVAIKARHYNITAFLLTQYYKLLPKKIRLQCNFLCMFACSNTEMQMLHEEFSPPGVTKKGFQRLIDDVLQEKKYNFLVINRTQPWETRFRKNLNNIIDLEQYKTLKKIKEEEEESAPMDVVTQDGSLLA